MGYTYVYAPDLNRVDCTSPLLDTVLLDMMRLNRNLLQKAIQEALAKPKNFDSGSLVQKNRIFTGYLQNGLEVKYFAQGEELSALVHPLDYQHPDNNAFYVVNQYTYIENGNNRRPGRYLLAYPRQRQVRCPWYFMPICCRRCWTAPPSWSWRTRPTRDSTVSPKSGLQKERPGGAGGPGNRKMSLLNKGQKRK